MTEETNSSTPDSVAKESAEHVNADWHLQLLVDFAESGMIVDTGITVFTAGGVFTGTLTTYEEWASSMVGAFMTISNSQENRSKLEELYLVGDHAVDSDFEIHTRQSIHLKDAQLVSGATMLPTQTGMFMRVRLEQVTGWTLGRMTVA